jgi:neopullulanase
MTGGDDPENRHDFPGGFPGSKQDAFTSAGRTPEQNEMHDWVAGLLRFRNSNAVFADGGQQDIMHNATSFVYVRSRDLKAGCGHGEPGRVLVAVNNAEEATTLQVDPTDTTLEGCAEFVPAAGTHIPVTLKMRTLMLTLGPKQVAIYDVR